MRSDLGTMACASKQCLQSAVAGARQWLADRGARAPRLASIAFDEKEGGLLASKELRFLMELGRRLRTVEEERVPRPHSPTFLFTREPRQPMHCVGCGTEFVRSENNERVCLFHDMDPVKTADGTIVAAAVPCPNAQQPCGVSLIVYRHGPKDAFDNCIIILWEKSHEVVRLLSREG